MSDMSLLDQYLHDFKKLGNIKLVIEYKGRKGHVIAIGVKKIWVRWLTDNKALVSTKSEGFFPEELVVVGTSEPIKRSVKVKDYFTF